MSGTAPITVSQGQPSAVGPAKGWGPRAHYASATLEFSSTLSMITLDASLLGPARGFNEIATVFVDNLSGSNDVQVAFVDSNVTAEAPAGSTVYMAAITSQLKVQFTCVTASEQLVNVCLLDFPTGPTGVQPISGTVTAVVGPVTVTNPGPAVGALSDLTQTVPATTATELFPANPNRKYFHAQFPAGTGSPVTGSSDGWYSFTNSNPAPEAAGCFYAGAGQEIYSEVFTPTNALYVYLTSGGVMPVNVG